MIEADQPEMPDLVLQPDERFTGTGVVEQFLVDTQRPLNVVLFFVALSLPRASVQSANLTSIFRVNVFVSRCGIAKLRFVLVRAFVECLCFFVQAMRKIELRNDVADFCLSSIFEFLWFFDLVNELVEGFPRRFVLVVSLLINRSSLHHVVTCGLLKFTTIFFVGRRP